MMGCIDAVVSRGPLLADLRDCVDAANRASVGNVCGCHRRLSIPTSLSGSNKKQGLHSVQIV